MSPWLYAIASVAVPCLIGVAMYGLFEVWDRRRRLAKKDDPLPRIDYFI